MLVAAVITIYIVFFIISLALCKAAGEADEKQKQWIEQREKEEQEAYKWCDDDCLHCEQNDWCKFSEVKKEGQA